MKKNFWLDFYKGFVFYPGAGTDFNMIAAIVSQYPDIPKTYVLADANRRPLSQTGFQGFVPTLNLENELGLSGFKIQNITTFTPFEAYFDFNNVNRRIEHILEGNEDQENLIENYKLYIDGILFPSMKRYSLKHLPTGIDIVLYYVEYEAIAVLQFFIGILEEIRRNIKELFYPFRSIDEIKVLATSKIFRLNEALFEPIIETSHFDLSLILSEPGGGWIGTGSFQDLLIKVYEDKDYLPARIFTNQIHFMPTKFKKGDPLNLPAVDPYFELKRR